MLFRFPNSTSSNRGLPQWDTFVCCRILWLQNPSGQTIEHTSALSTQSNNFKQSTWILATFYLPIDHVLWLSLDKAGRAVFALARRSIGQSSGSHEIPAQKPHWPIRSIHRYTAADSPVYIRRFPVHQVSSLAFPAAQVATRKAGNPGILNTQEVYYAHTKAAPSPLKQSLWCSFVCEYWFCGPSSGHR